MREIKDRESFLTEKVGGIVKVECCACRHSTRHEVLAQLNAEEEVKELGTMVNHYQIVRCLGCENFSFRNSFSIVTPTGYESASEELYPPRDDPRERKRIEGWIHLPPKVRTIYLETMRALKARAPILTAIGIRTLIETVSKHKRAKGKTLYLRIKNLADRKFLGEPEAKRLHRLRFLGNAAAHDAKPPTHTQLEFALDIAEHLLSSAYLIPLKSKKTRAS